METQSLPPVPPTFTQPQVGKGSPLKSLPAPVRFFIRPLLFLALGFHALLLFTPLPAEQKPKPPEDKKNPVKITQVPTVKPIKTAPTTQTTKVSKPEQPKITRSEPTVTLNKTEDRQEESAPPREQTPAKEAKPPSNVVDPFQGFPHYKPSTPDCFSKGLGESCRTTNANIAAVATFYKAELPKQQFTLTPVEDSAGKQIFQVSKGGKTRYLHLFEEQPITVILLSDNKTDLAGLKDSVVPPDEYVTLLGTVIPESDRGSGESTTPQYEQFDKPEFFYKPISAAELQRGTIPEPLPGLDNAKLAKGTPPDKLYTTFLEAELRTIFKEIKDEGQYGGGTLRRLKSDKTTLFLSLIPLNGGSGTIVVTWLKDPR